MIYLLLLPAVVILVVGFLLVFKAGSGRTIVYDKNSYADTQAKRQLEDLHRQQTHMFWRDFDK